APGGFRWHPISAPKRLIGTIGTIGSLLFLLADGVVLRASVELRLFLLPKITLQWTEYSLADLNSCAVLSHQTLLAVANGRLKTRPLSADEWKDEGFPAAAGLGGYLEPPKP